MTKKELRALLAHRAMTLTGGFLAAYAFLARGGVFGASATSNLIYLAVFGVSGDWKKLLIRLGAVTCYAAGLILSRLGNQYWKKVDFRYCSALIDLAVCLLLAQIPARIDPITALYPMYFAMAIQWVTFGQVNGYTSATPFSTSNLRQCLEGLTDFFCTRKKEHLRHCGFHLSTLLCFHTGVVYGWFCVKAWNVRSVYACIPLLVLCLFAVYLDNRVSPAKTAA